MNQIQIVNGINLLHVKFSDGRVISANGRFLWIYSPRNGIAGKQDLDPGRGTSGIAGILSGYENVTVMGSTIVLKSDVKHYKEIRLVTGGNSIPKALQLKSQGGKLTNISLTGVQTNVGLPSNLFNFHPPASAQIVENPLNQRE